MAQTIKSFVDGVKKQEELASWYEQDYVSVYDLVKDSYNEHKSYCSAEAESAGIYDESGNHGRSSRRPIRAYA